jgi:hypothetical protein
LTTQFDPAPKLQVFVWLWSDKTMSVAELARFNKMPINTRANDPIKEPNFFINTSVVSQLSNPWASGEYIQI